jgi:hypothetical protein
MDRAYILVIVTMFRALSFAQPPGLSELPNQAFAFQRAGSLGVDLGARGVTVPMLRADSGRPFSATTKTQTTQTYFDGTHVSQTTTIVEYRDAEGRTRIEAKPGVFSGPWKGVLIRDPVAGVTYSLDPARKTAVIMPRVPIAPGVVFDGFGDIAASTLPLARDTNSRGGLGAITTPNPNSQTSDMAVEGTPNASTEDLGSAIINGVSARGTRSTTVVPPGAIGNDREFRSISERWFSPDLNVLIKSISTDPRFGTTTYELTNINRLSPDPSLFRLPADYNVVAPGRRQ